MSIMEARHCPGKFNGLANFVVNELSDLFLLDFMSASNVTCLHGYSVKSWSLIHELYLDG